MVKNIKLQILNSFLFLFIIKYIFDKGLKTFGALFLLVNIKNIVSSEKGLQKCQVPYFGHILMKGIKQLNLDEVSN